MANQRLLKAASSCLGRFRHSTVFERGRFIRSVRTWLEQTRAGEMLGRRKLARAGCHGPSPELTRMSTNQNERRCPAPGVREEPIAPVPR